MHHKNLALSNPPQTSVFGELIPARKSGNVLIEGILVALDYRSSFANSLLFGF